MCTGGSIQKSTFPADNSFGVSFLGIKKLSTEILGASFAKFLPLPRRQGGGGLLQVYVEGRLRSRSYEGRDGQTRFVNEINVTDVQFLGGGNQMGEERPAYGQDSMAPNEPPAFEDIDDLPF